MVFKENTGTEQCGEYYTMILVRSFQVVSVSQESPDSLSQTVLVGLLGSLIQQSVGNQPRVPAVLNILTRDTRKLQNDKLLQHLVPLKSALAEKMWFLWLLFQAPPIIKSVHMCAAWYKDTCWFALLLSPFITTLVNVFFKTQILGCGCFIWQVNQESLSCTR